MDILNYTEEHHIFRDAVRKFMAKEVSPHVDDWERAGIVSRDVIVETSMAKAWITEMANRVTDGCVRLHGGYGYGEEYPVARDWRDMRVMSIFAGTNEIMRGIAAKFMGL
ncbi:MAG: acyl-CoA dehydrogenase family protein [Proteobacteria bacterium]|nr:acyl-CoA dehydrogenase family protein [Pseudomonadota bacterium]MBU1741245.1 acyl-CoA dehydrogenase family protein [Pseudomonadota bacterium]